MLMSCLVISNKRVLFKHNQFLGFIWLYGRRETFCVIGITMHHIVLNYQVYRLCSNSDTDYLTNGYILSILRMLILYQGLNFFMYLQKVFTHMIQVQTLDSSRYNKIRYCPQHNCEGNTSVVLRTHERHPYLGRAMGVFRELFGEKWPWDIGRALICRLITGLWYRTMIE